MRAPVAAALAAGGLALAACAPDRDAARGAIIGGTYDDGDAAVMLLVSWPFDESTFFTCTAALVSPTVLATAAHCVDAPNHPNFRYGAFPGPDASAYATLAQLKPQLLAVDTVHAHPGYDPAPPFTADVGAAILASPATVSPLLLHRAPLDAALVGEPARIVGYGQTSYGVYNARKHAAATTVAAVAADTVQVGDGTRRSCVGDSGGPALVWFGGVEEIVGIDSYTDTTGCTAPAHYRRVDVYAAFFDGYAPPDLGAPDLAARDLSFARDLAAYDLASSDLADAKDLAPPDLAAADLARVTVEDGGCRVAGRGAGGAWLCGALAMVARLRRRRARQAAR